MVKLNYNIYGEGEPLIVLHGLFGSARNWNAVAKVLSRDRRIITVDLRNHGDSEHTEAMTYQEMADDIHHLTVELGLATTGLLGHSMGGKAAMAFALSYPGKTDALMVVDIAPVDYQPHYRDYIDAMQALPLGRIRNRTEADKLLQSAGVADAMIRQFLLQNLIREGEEYRWRINLPVLKQSLQELASFPREWPSGSYEGPACFLAGGESDYIQPRHYSEIARYFPGARVETIEEAGHWIHAQKPDAVVSAVRTFMDYQ